MTEPPPTPGTARLWRWLGISRAAVRAALGRVVGPVRERLAPAAPPVPSGLYRTNTAHPAVALADGARRASRAVHMIDLARVTTKAGLLTEFARRLSFPDYFGHNWDALDESLRDLAYLPGAGYVLLISHGDRLAAADPAAWRTALTVFAHAAAEPTPAARTLVIVIIDPTGAAASLPSLPGT